MLSYLDNHLLVCASPDNIEEYYITCMIIQSQKCNSLGGGGGRVMTLYSKKEIHPWIR